jgi:hypothetical protein
MKKTTRLLCFASLIAFATASCSKNNTCGHTVNYYPFNIAFKGFISSDLGKVVINTYDSSNQILKTDTSDFSSATFNGDTATSPNQGFLNVQTGKSYEITVLARNKTFKISNIHEGDKYYSWTEKDMCSPGSTQPENRPYLFELNGQQITHQGSTVYLAN